MELDNVEDIYALSPMQEGMLYHTLSDPQSGVFVSQVCCELAGNLDVSRLQSSWDHVVQKQAALHTVFLWDGLDSPLQVVRQRVETPWEHQDWTHLNQEQQQKRLSDLLLQDRRRGLELSQDPVMRMTLIQETSSRWRWIWTVHHMICDGWSAAMILRDFFQRYSGVRQDETAGAESVFLYRDYIVWLQQCDLEFAESFWREQLAGFEEPTRIHAIGYSTNHPEEPRRRQQTRFIGRTVADSIRRFVKDQRVTLNTAVLGAWALLLCQYGDQDDVVFGVTVSGRPPALPGIEDAVGLFINTLPMRIQTPGDANLNDWLREIQSQLIQMRDLEYSPLSKVQSWSEIPRGQPLFDSVVVFENYPSSDALVTNSALEVSEIQVLDQSNYPLALLILPKDEIELICIHDPERFSSEFIGQLTNDFVSILKQFTQASATQLADISPGPGSSFMSVCGRATTESPSGCCRIHDLFERNARQSPDAIAVVSEERTLTYRQLENCANSLARELRDQGVGPDARVGIYCERSCELIIGILAVLKAGGAYVPLDPRYPDDHIRFIAADAEIDVVLVPDTLKQRVPVDAAKLVTISDLDWLADDSIDPPAVQTNGDNVAYVIYTSGSSGKPKGVLVSHRNLLHSTFARMALYRAPVGRFLLLSSFAFDSSVAGIFWTLCDGGTLVLPRPGAEQDAKELLQLIADQQITHTLCLPSLYSILINDARHDQVVSLEVSIVAGEPCSFPVYEAHRNKAPGAMLYNEYGPTEATVWSTVYRLTDADVGQQIPIGKPIPGSSVYVLDRRGRPAPVGVPGEVFIGGDGVAVGYLNRPELTSECFVLRTIGDSGPSRLYRTGDLACYRPDGNLMFLGRADRQVKIRGYRIELGEIEQVLRQHPAVSEAVTIARDKTNRDQDVETICARLNALDSEHAFRLLRQVEFLPEDQTGHRHRDDREP